MRRRRPGHGHDRRAHPLIEPFDEEALAEARAFNADLARQLAGTPSVETLPVEVTRRLRRERGGMFPPPVFLDEAEDRVVPTRAGDLRLRVLRPDRDPAGVYLHFHGGGWTLGGCDEQDSRLLALANSTGLVAASFEYRLAPEHPYPAALDDCEDAALWLLDGGAAELGAPAVFALGGESAGGHLSAMTLLRVRDRHGISGAFRAVTFVYGSFDLSLTPSARIRGAVDPILSRPVMAWFRDCFVPGTGTDDRRDPEISPLYADLRDLPPALFSAAQLDPLLDDSLFMAARWRAAGNEAEVRVWPEMLHGFGAYPLAVARAAAEAQWAFLSAALPASA
ncbi:MAG: alpha/beta hydrolase [Gaiellaceae bacterium]